MFLGSMFLTIAFTRSNVSRERVKVCRRPLFREGREVARQAGATDAASLSRWLDQALT